MTRVAGCAALSRPTSSPQSRRISHESPNTIFPRNFPMPTAPVRNGEIYFEESGSGEAIILLPGLGHEIPEPACLLPCKAMVRPGEREGGSAAGPKPRHRFRSCAGIPARENARARVCLSKSGRTIPPKPAWILACSATVRLGIQVNDCRQGACATGLRTLGGGIT